MSTPIVHNVKIYFSYYQTNDSTLANLVRRFQYMATLTKILQSHGLNYASIYHGRGIYKSSSEPSILLEFYLEPDQLEAVQATAEALKIALHQDSVMLVNGSQVSFI